MVNIFELETDWPPGSFVWVIALPSTSTPMLLFHGWNLICIPGGVICRCHCLSSFIPLFSTFTLFALKTGWGLLSGEVVLQHQLNIHFIDALHFLGCTVNVCIRSWVGSCVWVIVSPMSTFPFVSAMPLRFYYSWCNNCNGMGSFVWVIVSPMSTFIFCQQCHLFCMMHG